MTSPRKVKRGNTSDNCSDLNLKTYRRITKKIQQFLDDLNMPIDEFAAQLQEADEHNRLLGWCFIGTGQNQTPFYEFRQQHPAFWSDCVKAFGY